MKKHRMKRILIAVFILLFSFALWSCQTKPDDEDPRKLDMANIDSVISFYNYHTNQIAKLFENSDNDMDTQLVEALNDLDFSIDEFTYIGDNDISPELIIFRDRMLFVTGNEYDDNRVDSTYKTILKLYNEGSVTINSQNDEVNVALSEQTGASVTSILKIKKVLNDLELKSEHIKPLQKDGVYSIEKDYVEGLVKTLGLNDLSFASFGLTLEEFCELTFTLDLSNYDKNGTMAISASGKPLDKSLLLTIDLSKYDEHNGTTSFSLKLPSMTFFATVEWNQDKLNNLDIKATDDNENTVIEIKYAYDTEASPLPIDTPIESCDTEKLSIKISLNQENTIDFTLASAQLQDNHYVGCFALTIGGKTIGNSVNPIFAKPLDSSALETVNFDGTFDIGVDDNNSPTSLYIDAAINTAEEKITACIELNLTNVTKENDEIARIKLVYTGLSDAEPDETTLLFTLTTQTFTEQNAKFSLVGTIDRNSKKETLMATLHWPANVEISLDEMEQEYLSRADALFENYDAVMLKITELNSKATEYAKEQIQINAPLKYYYYDDKTEQYLFTDITLNGNQFYVNTSCVINYEDIILYYAKHNGSFVQYNDSVVMQEAKKLQQLINNSRSDCYVENDATYLVSQHLPNLDMYLVMFANYPATATLYNERVTQAMIDDYVLHEVSSSADGQLNIHNFDVTYNETCMASYLCNDCGFEMRSTSPAHKMCSDIVIREGNTAQTRITLSICEVCGAGHLLFDDQKSHQLKVSLVPVKNSILEEKNEYGPKDLVIEGYKDISPHLAGFYSAPLDIPNIEPQTGFRIVAATKKAGSFSPRLHNTLILPEGLEIIDHEAFRLCGFTEIILPSTLKSIKSGAFAGCGIKEIVIPESVTYMSSTALSSATLERIIVNARYMEFFEIPYNTPDLYEIVFNGQIDKIIGSSTYQIEILVIPEGVTSIVGWYNNQHLKKLVLPSTLQFIDASAFCDCTSLEEVVLPSGLISIGENAFEGCTSLSRVWINGMDEANIKDGQFILPDTIVELAPYAFYRCSALKSINIPTSATVISTGLFNRCELLTAVDIHDDITDIESYAFSNCGNLSVFKMPAKLNTIGDRAFSNCFSLTDKNVVFGDNLQRIEDLAFEYCTGIRNIQLPISLQSLHSNPFSKCQFDTVYVTSTIHSGSGTGCWGASADVLTLEKGFSGKLPIAKVINIMSTDVPEGDPHKIHMVSSAVLVINFAGNQETWEKTMYSVSSSTQINFNVIFDKETYE